VSENLLKRYADERAVPIEADVERIEALGVRCITGDFAAEGDVLRHAADRVSLTLLRTGMLGRPKSISMAFRRNGQSGIESREPH
jgi:hypothetical protein